MMKAPTRLGAFVLLAMALNGCYVPVRFDAEVVVTKRGLYEMFFAGYMADTDLYDGLRQGKISPIAERKKVARIETDLTRDSATKKFKYIKRGFFELNWEKKGDLLRVRNVTFIRRNEEILTVSYVEETGEITMRGKSISKANARKLLDIGLNSEGEIRFVTDLRVISSNATGKRPHKARPGYTEYFWTIKKLGDSAPKIVATF